MVATAKSQKNKHLPQVPEEDTSSLLLALGGGVNQKTLPGGSAYILSQQHHTPIAPTTIAGNEGSLSPVWSLDSSSVDASGECIGAAPPVSTSLMDTSAIYNHSLVAEGGGSNSLLLDYCANPTSVISSSPLFTAAAAVNNNLPTCTTAAAASDAQDTAMLDGWLQQFVNQDAMDGLSNQQPLPPRATSAEFTFGSASSTLSQPSPLSNDAVGLLDQSAVDAMASVAAANISEDILASMMSGAPEHPPQFPELTMLAALPFPPSGMMASTTAGVTASPMVNIAPQKTVSSSSPAQQQPPPAKRQRRKQQTTNSSSETNSGKQVSTSTKRLMPLAPRQPSPPTTTTKKQKTTTSVKKEIEQEAKKGGVASHVPRSGSNTPPGLGVLAKIAQKQVPIQVKLEPQQYGRHIAPNGAKAIIPTTTSVKSAASATQSSSPPADTAAQKRQERLIKNRAAALLSRKRKREYLSKLETEVEELRESNSSLAKRLEEMELRLQAMANERDQLRNSSTAATTSPSSASSSSSGLSSNRKDVSKKEVEKATTTSNSASAENTSGQQEKPGDSMEVDKPVSNRPVAVAAGAARKQHQQQRQRKTEKIRELVKERPIRPRIRVPDIAPKISDNVQSTTTAERGGGGGGVAGPSRQRTAGALLMAMLFSFSLFTLPSLYTSSSGNQIAAGGSLSAGIPPPISGGKVISPPTPPNVEQQQQQLLIGSKETISSSSSTPLLERVQKSVSELTQQAVKEEDTNKSSSPRPMTMRESAGLHAWIKHGLSAEKVNDGSKAQPSSSSLAVVNEGKQQEYAMLYCPSMQHVLLGGGGNENSMMNVVYQPKQPRVIQASRRQESNLEDVDDKTPPVLDVEDGRTTAISSPRAEDALVEARKQQQDSTAMRPKMSLYSPVVTSEEQQHPHSPPANSDGVNGDEEILAPWAECARNKKSNASQQKYLRIDVEVVGSRWVTADKFTNGIIN